MGLGLTIREARQRALKKMSNAGTLATHAETGRISSAVAVSRSIFARCEEGWTAVYTLHAFGGLSLHGPDGIVAGAAAQRRKLALLSMLATAGERGVSRDRLIAVLWPESDLGHARHVLTQTLSSLRRELGSEELVLGNADLRLNPTRIDSDVAQFDARLREKDCAGAVSLYAGPFLDGVHVTGAPEFDQWVDEQRGRYHIRAADAVEALAREEATNGNHAAAARWWQRRVALDPLDSAAAYQYMISLVNAGDLAGALQHARVHRELLRAEFGVDPDSAISDLEMRLRSELEVRPAAKGPKATAPTEKQDLSSVDAARLRAVAVRYDIERELGRTAMTWVFLARSKHDHRSVELKAFAPAPARIFESPAAVQDLKRLDRITHGRIVPLIDADAAPGVAFYVTPSVDGETLRARLKRGGPLPIPDALSITMQISEALASAHGHGVLHLDVKPRTILLTSTGAMLTDVGVAQLINKFSSGGDGRTTVAIGSPPYMSPEQAAGEEQLDARSDIYSLACVLYEMLAGEPPFTGRTAGAVLAKRWTQPVPALASMRDNISPSLERHIQRALARTPADRFGDATEFRRALASV